MTALAVTALIVVIGFSPACEEPGEVMTDTRTVALEGAVRALVGIDMGAGELKLRAADQEPLLEAYFEFNRERNRPELEYDLLGDKGILKIRHARGRGINFGTTRNRWDLTLSRAVPLELDIDLGAGRNDLDLRGLKLERLEIDMGAGEMVLNIQGSHERSFNVRIDGGVGSARIYLPEEAGVRVKVDGGIGSVDLGGLTKAGGAYVNDAYGKSEVTIDVDIDGGIGSIELVRETAGKVKI